MKQALFGAKASSQDERLSSTEQNLTDGTEESFGLFELWPATPDGEVARRKTSIDIIAIHGLGGHPRKTWTEGDRFWLAQFLPAKIPEARILTFGYNSGVAFSGSASRLNDFALQLLEAMRRLRRKTKEPKRKTIFVCHSLGGIVFKKALIIAHERDMYSEIEQSIMSVIFMGTPHRGADFAFWAKLLGNLANLPIPGSIRTGLLSDLQPKSQMLGDVCSQFIDRGKQLRIFSLYERLKMKGLNDLIVDEHSAVLYLPNETPMPVEADHRTICKFSSAYSQAYLAVEDVIVELIEDSVEGDPTLYLRPDDQKFLQILRRIDHKAVLERIPPRFKFSCQWIKSDPTYVTWKDNLGNHNNRLLWLHGPRGSGKTMITKYIFTHLDITLNQDIPLAVSKKPLVRHCIAYFFCNNTTSGQKTLQSLLQSLLYQILSRAENSRMFRLFDISTLIYSEVVLEDISKLWECLSQITYQSSGIYFWLIIDAIDELGDDVEKELLRGLEQIMAGDIIGRVKIFISSRYLPGQDSPFSVNLGPLGILRISMDNENAQRDVEIFMRSKIAELCEKASNQRDFQRDLEQKLLQGPKRTFLHASLIWESFAKGADSWTRWQTKQKLNEIDSKMFSLESCYCELLGRIPDKFQRTVKLALAWVLSTSGQLNIKQLCIAVSIRSHHKSHAELIGDVDDCFLQSFREHCRYLFTIGKDGLVSISHHSVKEMLLQSSGSSEITPQNAAILRLFQMSMTDTHLMIAQSCFTLMQFMEFSKARDNSVFIPREKFRLFSHEEGREICREAFEQFPMLEYAFRQWPLHCSQLNEYEIAEDLYKFIKSWQADYFRLAASPWTTETFQLIPDQVMADVELDVPSLHHLIQRGDFADVTRMLIESGKDINQLDGAGLSPLCWTIIRDRRKSFDVLMKCENLDPNKGRNETDRPIHYCIRWQRTGYLHRLLQHPRVNINIQGRMKQTPLHTALDQAAAAAVDSLLKLEEIDLLAQDEDGKTPLETAFKKGHSQLAVKRMVGMVDIKYVPRILTSNWPEVEEAIIEKDPSRVFELGDDGMNVLTRYAYYGRREKVEMILLKLAPESLTKKTEWGKYNLIHLCAHQDWESIVQLLHEKFGLEGLGSDHVGRTLLHWAVELGWAYGFLDHWKKPKSWLNRQDRDGLTALHLAVMFRNIDAIQSLMEQGADYLLPDKHGKNAVHLSAETGFRKALRIFMIQKTREFGRDNSGASLLHFLAMWQEADFISRFIERKKLRVNVRDKNRRTPLHFACLHCNVPAVKALLDHNASLCMKDSSGRTALHIALQEGHLELVQVLINNGADLYESDGLQQNCLQIAIRSQNPSTIQFVLDRIPFVLDRDKLGRSALHRACESGDKDLNVKLIELGSNVNLADNFLYTPLHIAVIRRNHPAVMALTQCRNLKVSALDQHDCTALDRAQADNSFEIAKTLVARGATTTPGYSWKLRGQVPLQSIFSMLVCSEGPLVVYGARK